MQKRYVLLAVLVAIFATKWWYTPGEDTPSLTLTTDSLPERVKKWLDNYNMTEVIDGNLEAFGISGSVRPGLSPDAPAPKHPVVIVPGITSCGLEVWKAHPCLGDSFFRKRVWGDISMAQAILSNWSCWLHHITPNATTGSDRDGVRVRPATGLRSADYFVGNYWLWARAIQNLADIGYNEADILLACFDWRLAFPLLEERDGYFSGLKYDIEKLVVRHKGEKAVILAHSMGSLVWQYFMNWVEAEEEGWVDKNIDSFVNIAGAMLGAMGPLAAYISGEMDATAAMGPFATYVESFAMSFDEMRDIYWSMGGLASILPVGGPAVWGSQSSGWTDTPADVVAFSDTINASGLQGDLDSIYGSVKKKKEFLPLHNLPSWTAYDRDIHKPDAKTKDPTRYANPLATPLPNAPNLKIFCMYGTGQPTERAYRYGFRQIRWRWGDNASLPESIIFSWSSMKTIEDTIAELESYNKKENCALRPVKLDARGFADLTFQNISEAIAGLEDLIQNPAPALQDWMRIDSGYHSNATDDPWGNGLDGRYAYGVAKTDGDSTVPLASLGYMCHNGWRDLPEFNPSGVKVWTKEFKHLPSSLLADARGGPATAKHVEIIGNVELLTDMLNIVAGNTTYLQEDRIFSNITTLGPMITERIRKVLDGKSLEKS
mmetsp:Transcript_88664/g.185296  ORF Transcript_88664/g.185296 Transcript_88664/m.185296 type:complete len:659 (-) Transcript_88664:449-2425(-)